MVYKQRTEMKQKTCISVLISINFVFLFDEMAYFAILLDMGIWSVISLME